MKLYIVQEHVRGPWRWAITDDEDRVIAKSAIAYKREGWARNGLFEFVDGLVTTTAGVQLNPICVPSVQLDLFRNDKIKG